MKKILLLSSILFIFLSACGSAETSIPATPTSTLAPPATATALPATATEAPTATATAKPIDWATASDQQKLDAAPIIEGLTPNISPNPFHPNDIIYRDVVTGEAIKAVDLTTGKEIALTDAGVINHPQTDGGKFETLSFENTDVTFDYIVNKVGTVWNDMYMFSNQNVTEASKKQLDMLSKIPNMGINYMGGVTVTADKDQFKVMIYSLDKGTIIGYKDDKLESNYIFVDFDTITLVQQLRSKSILIPSKPEN